jgi:hypothetical protein
MNGNKLAIGVAMLALIGQSAFAAPQVPATQAAASQPAAKGEPLTVAILDFETGPAGGEMGKQIPDALAALLTESKGIRLVDRTSMAKTLQEHALNLTGLVEADKAVQIGKVVGAKILVTGKVFTLGKSTYVTAKIIGTETSLVEGVLVKGKENDDVGLLVAALSDKLGKQLAESGPKLVAGPDAADGKLDALKAKFARIEKKPTVVVTIKEEHHGEVRRAIDPAVETEVRNLLQGCGFTVVGPEDAKGAQYEVSGEAFSEFAGRVGNLVSCAARAEITIKSRDDGKVVLSTKATSRGVDLAENLAGKTALQKAGHTLGIEVLETFAKMLPEKPQ